MPKEKINIYDPTRDAYFEASIEVAEKFAKFIEKAFGKDSIGVKSKIGISDQGNHATISHIRRYKNEADKAAGVIYSDKEAMRLFGHKQFSTIHSNMLVNEGINEMWTVLCSAGGQEWDNTNAVCIVGTGSGAAAAGDTRATFTSPVEKAMDGGYPTFGTSQKAVFRATYGSGDANQAWNEFGVLNTITTGDLMNRKVSAEGTKVVGQTWELTIEITLS